MRRLQGRHTPVGSAMFLGSRNSTPNDDGSVSSSPTSLSSSFVCSFKEQQRGGWVNPRLWAWRYKSTNRHLVYTNRWRVPETTPENAAWQLHHREAHEREAFENFAVYATDREDEMKPHYHVTTDNLDDMSPMERLKVLKHNIQDRYQVVDKYRSLDKVKLLLKALECYEDLSDAGRIPNNNIFELGGEYLEDFEHFAEAVLNVAEKSVTKHPDVVAAMIRVADISDKCGHREIRDRSLMRAEAAAERMDSAYDHALPEDYNRDLPERIAKKTFEGAILKAARLDNSFRNNNITGTTERLNHSVRKEPLRHDESQPSELLGKLSVPHIPYPSTKSLQVPRYQKLALTNRHFGSRKPDWENQRNPFTPGTTTFAPPELDL